MHKRIPDYYRQAFKAVIKDIKKEDDERVLNSDKSKLVDYFFNKYRLHKIELEGEFEVVQDKKIRVVPAREREEVYRNEGDVEWEVKYFDLQVDLKRNPDIKLLTEDFYPTTMSMGWTPGDFNWRESEVSARVVYDDYGKNLSEDQIKKRITEQKERINNYVNWVNKDIKKGNDELKNKIEKEIEGRRKELKEDDDFISGLCEEIDIPLRKEKSDVRTRVELSSTPLVKNVKPDPKTPIEYKLDRDKVIDAVSIIENQGEQFEKTPCTFQNSDEEDLRNIFLVNLNTVFEGAATGETFQNKGKTDIYLNIEQGKILVFECKIWGGNVKYQNAIKQLLGYLTWRNNFGVLITFSRNKNFSSVLSEVEKAIKKTSSFIGGFQKQKDNHSISKHSFNDKDEKEVEIHHLIYNIYCEE